MPLPPLPLSPLRPRSVEAFVFRCPISVPVQTSFGTMHDRPAVFVRVVDHDGAEGWGEVWCNFPSCGAEHRARLVETVAAPALIGRDFEGPAAAFDWLSARTAVLAIQSGEPGPIAQAIAGVDLALWDLCARRSGLPLWRYLGGASGRVGVYASGINPDGCDRMAADRQAAGYRIFKLKIGFGEQRDLANLAAMRQAVGPEAGLLVDVNQGWSLQEALQRVPGLAPFDLGWLEEPLRADRPWSEWQALARATPIPLAAGENVAGLGSFETALASKALQVVQPDIAKWGGISGTWPVVAAAQGAGLRYCPHYLGGGIGLLHSAHLLAASGESSRGMLEIDANVNPLRTAVAGPLNTVDAGSCILGDAPGIGIVPDLQSLAAVAAAGC